MNGWGLSPDNKYVLKRVNDDPSAQRAVLMPYYRGRGSLLAAA